MKQAEEAAVTLRAGGRYSSATCTTQVVVVRASASAGTLECGGAPMVDGDQAPGAGVEPAPGLDGGTRIGKRYRDSSGSLEVLCVKGGAGTLCLGGQPMELAAAKQLPASD